MRKKAISAVAVVAAAVVALATPASAAVSSIAISPTSQTVASGTTAYWGWSWAGSGTYAPKFYYGDGSYRTYTSQSGGGSGSASDTWSVCSDITYIQRIVVDTSQASGTTLVKHGTFC